MKFILSILLYSCLIADDISELIIKIKNAPSTEKRVLMNELKLKLRDANQQHRLDAIEKLRTMHHIPHNIHYNHKNSYFRNSQQSVSHNTHDKKEKKHD